MRGVVGGAGLEEWGFGAGPMWGWRYVSFQVDRVRVPVKSFAQVCCAVAGTQCSDCPRESLQVCAGQIIRTNDGVVAFTRRGGNDVCWGGFGGNWVW